MHEVVRRLIQDLTKNPALQSLAMSAYVPIEILNIILASTELPANYRTNIFDIRTRILGDKNIDYFSIVSLLFYYRSSDPALCEEVEDRLRASFLPGALPARSSHDAHFMLDLIACPYLSRDFRRLVLEQLYKGLGISSGQFFSFAVVAEIEENPWFINWGQIDLLNHLRK